MSSPHEDRLQADLKWIHELVAIVGENIDTALRNSVRALLSRDYDLATEVIVGDFLVNRQTRELDRLCHEFVSQHLPSAGHLRFVSSVMRLNIALERIGDYATTIARTVASLSTDVPSVVQRDLEMMCGQARSMLKDALKSFTKHDVKLATSTLSSASQFAQHFDKVFADLTGVGERHARPVSDLFALMAGVHRLERVIHQAKNICEETVFVDTGRAKGEKVFQLLFVDATNSGLSLLAEAFTERSFPQSGTYASAGWQPKEEVDPQYEAFAKSVGLDLTTSWPQSVAALRDKLGEYNFIIGLHQDTRQHLGPVPFHTSVLVWDLESAASPEEQYRVVVSKIRGLLEQLRGEHAC